MARSRGQRSPGPVGARTLVGSKPVQRGEVYCLRAGQAEEINERAGESQPVLFDKEAETADDDKRRPVVIVSRDDLNHGHSVMVVPFFSQQLEKRSKYRSSVLFKAGEAGLTKDCVAKCDDTGSLSKTRIDLASGPIGRVTAPKMAQIVEAIRYCIRDDTLPPPASEPGSE